MSKMFVIVNHRGNSYGMSFETMWPHVSLGVSAHLSSRFGHVTFHTPIGYCIIGCLGSSLVTEDE